MIPIEKNITVTDVNGKIIGSTYPKRAKGLVKNGRAEFADDQTIRLKLTHSPTADKNTEDKKMSKVIDFNAREFKFDQSCQSNVGERLFMTTALGNAEVWEIGDWRWNWSQIVCEKALEKNTDYLFRFAMTGGHNDTGDGTSLAILCASDGYDTPEQAWEDRMTFALGKSRYEPAISKRDKTGLLRLFEIPFNTGEHENWRIFFIAQHSVARFFAPKNYTDYETLEDLTYDEWWSERRKQLSSEMMHGNEYLDKMNQFAKIAMAIDSAERLYDHADSDDDDNGGDDTDTGEGSGISGCNTEYNEEQFAAFIRTCGNGSMVSLDNVFVYTDGRRDLYDIGGSIDGAAIDISNATLTAKAFSMIVAKLGDGCAADMDNITVTKDGIDNMYSAFSKVDGTVISLDNATLPQAALKLLYDKLGDGCHISTDNCSIVSEQHEQAE